MKSRYKLHSEWIGVTAFRVKPVQKNDFLSNAMKESLKLQEAICSHRPRKRSEASLPVNRTKMVCHVTSRIGDNMENKMAVNQQLRYHIYDVYPMAELFRCDENTLGGFTQTSKMDELFEKPTRPGSQPHLWMTIGKGTCFRWQCAPKQGSLRK